MLSILGRSRRKPGRVGLCLHADGVALAQLRPPREGGRPQLVACEWRPVPEPSGLARTLAALARERGLAGMRCVPLLPPEQYSLRLVDAPEVEGPELAAAVRWLVSDLLEFDIEQAVVDYFEIPQQQARGRPPRLHVVAARAALVQSVVDAARGAGLAIEAIDVTELALRNLAARLEENEQGVALMQLRPGGGLLVTAQAGNVYLTRRLELGLDRLAADHGSAELPEALRFEEEPESLDALVLEIQRSLDYYESQLGQPPVASLVVAPFEREMPELLPQLEKRLTVSVRAFELGEVVESAQSWAQPVEARCLTAIGAALRESGGPP